MNSSIDILVSGHLCLDLIPGMRRVTVADMVTPGRLYSIDPIAVSTGGAVSNTGLALHRLGVNTQFLATVGDDLIGQMILMYIRQRDPKLADHIRVRAGLASSSTIALSPSNADRTFLHCAGTNDTFGFADIDYNLVRQARVFHFGYPALLPQTVQDDGAELEAIFREAKQCEVVTSLDMAQPDPNGMVAKLNWRRIFERSLPYVDVFLPSIEETILTLRRSTYDAWTPNTLQHLDRTFLYELAGELLDMGAGVAGFKLGEMGIYLRTGDVTKLEKLAGLGINAEAWAKRELWHPAFKVQVAGTTGAGDSAFAGFLGAMIKGYGPEQAVEWACAVGACNVEAPDATSGILTWEATEKRLSAGWAFNEVHLPGF
ncbi:MAG: carbohydrate kinase family protein [Anaerolineae bacterium]|nr:carbohydrate kinase family protein [Anaerolineae bacterium]